MRGRTKILGWVLGIVIGLPILLVAIVLVGANTNPGRHLIEKATLDLSGGTVALHGLSGRFPDALRATRIEVSDTQGVWLVIDDLALDWSPLRLIRRTAQIDRLSATRIEISRQPADSESSSSGNGSFTLPVRVNIDSLQIERLDLAAAVAGKPASVKVSGKLDLASLQQGEASIAADRIDSPGSYKFEGKIDGENIETNIDISEPATGLIAGIANLPELGPLSLHSSLSGSRSAEKTEFTLTAGPLQAKAEGTVDLDHQTADLDLSGSAPAMKLRPEVFWQSVSVDAHMHGSLTAPQASGHLAIEGLNAGGASIRSISADLSGDLGKIGLRATIAGLHLPGPSPDLLASAPLELHADAQLDKDSRPVTFTLSHPLFTASGHAATGTPPSADVTLTLPKLAPFAAVAGIDVEGHSTLNAQVSLDRNIVKIALDGIVGVTGGMAPLPGLIGDAGKITVTASAQGEDITVDRAEINGKTLKVSATGSDKNNILDLDWKAALSSLAVIAPGLSGGITTQGHLQGPQTDLSLAATSEGEIAAPGFGKSKVSLTLKAKGLPNAPSGEIEAQGMADGAPLRLAAAVARSTNGAIHLDIQRGEWKSAKLNGTLTLAAGSTQPLGKAELHLARLTDFQGLIGQPLSGGLDATLNLVAQGKNAQARIAVDGQKIAVGDNAVGHLAITGQVDNPMDRPLAALHIAADDIHASGIDGAAKIEVNGPQQALAIALSADLHHLADHDAKITSAAVVNATALQVRVSTLQMDYAGEQAKLLAPVRFDFAKGIAVDRLRLGVGQAVLDVAGQISPNLNLTASLHDLSPALAKPFMPDLVANGTLNLDAKLTGSLAAPQGTISAKGRGLQMRSGPGGAIAAADLDATAQLGGQTMRIDSKISAGSAIHLTVNGQIPLQPSGAFDVHGHGNVDLAVLDPILTAHAQRVRGEIALDAGMTGTLAAPRMVGTAKLTGGEIQDFVQGIHVTALTGTIEAKDDVLRLVGFTGHADPGSIAVSGTISPLASGMPTDLSVTIQNARPLVSDLLTANMDGTVTIKGQASQHLDIGGRINVTRADINIPDSFPAGVAVLDVRRPGYKPPPPSPPGLEIALDLTIDAPERVFVRGHGLDAEMGGRLRLGGTSHTPQIDGGFDLRRGTFSIAGTTLNFTSGKVAFDGGGLNSRLDPTLNFVAQSSSGQVTATLAITGYADAPKIKLSSVPELPADEVLAQVMFGQSMSQLSPFQIAEIAQALAALGGFDTGNPIASVRRSLGLDRLSVGGASGGKGATVEAGKYVAEGVYVGSKQNTSGGTQAQVQIDLTKHLKAQTTLGTGGTVTTGTTPQNDPGSSVGLSYQFEY